ncbi:putative aminodeoxychorismate lyase protein [Erysiphe necator]|uniref:Putative aminodeoxychorismate lyase protein n=1 Tax=Uncinula necator TaxID=52586 RepID=A0A0B1P1B6_UNCNE|nr:putative aminodeoxychorismate lyase protein [Erysiphe necator]
MSGSNQSEFQLFTSLRYDPSHSFRESSPDLGSGFEVFYMPFYHHKRLLQACKFFGWSKATAKIEDSKEFLSDIEKFVTFQLIEDHDISSPLRLKLIVYKDGKIVYKGEPTPSIDVRNLYPLNLSDLLYTHKIECSSHTYKLYVSRQKIHPGSHTRIKTTFRQPYHLAQGEVGILHKLGDNEVLLTNHSGEIMEGSYTSVYFRRNGQWITPSIEAGGQDGTTRKWALDQGFVIFTTP